MKLFPVAAGLSPEQFCQTGPCRIDVANRLLLRDGEPLPLTPQAVDTLLALIQSGGQALRISAQVA